MDRYLLRELLVPLGYCLCGFMLIWISADLFTNLQDFQDKRLTLGEIGLYYLVIMPGFMTTVLPIALLLALLYTLTNHARNHEITAIRAAGVSMWRLCLPYFLVGLAASATLFAINEFWAPDSDDRAAEIYSRHVKRAAGAGTHQVRQLAFTNARDGRRWVIGLYDWGTAKMVNPNVLWREADGSLLRLEAREAELVDGVWTFSQVRQYRMSAQGNDLPELLLQTNRLAMPQFSETPEQIRSEIRISSQLGSSGWAKKTDLPIRAILDYMRLHPSPEQATHAKLGTKLQGRLAAPWTCLVVVLIAVPFGAASGRRNVFVGVAGSIAICFAYFVLQQIGLALGSSGELPAWLAAWSPNLTFGLAGLWLTARVR